MNINVEHEKKINAFARFFGSLLTELQYHDLGLKRQAHPVLIEDTTKRKIKRTSTYLEHL